MGQIGGLALTENLGERVRAVEEGLKATKERLLKAEDIIDTIHKLTVSIDRIAGQVDMQSKEIADMSDRISSIEDIPKKRWNEIVKAMIAVGAGMFFEYLLRRGT